MLNKIIFDQDGLCDTGERVKDRGNNGEGEGDQSEYRKVVEENQLL